MLCTPFELTSQLCNFFIWLTYKSVRIHFLYQLSLFLGYSKAIGKKEVRIKEGMTVSQFSLNLGRPGKPQTRQEEVMEFTLPCLSFSVFWVTRGGSCSPICWIQCRICSFRFFSVELWTVFFFSTTLLHDRVDQVQHLKLSFSHNPS